MSEVFKIFALKTQDRLEKDFLNSFYIKIDTTINKLIKKIKSMNHEDKEEILVLIKGLKFNFENINEFNFELANKINCESWVVKFI